MHDDDFLRVWQACKAKATHDFLQTIPGMADQHATCVVAPTFKEAKRIVCALGVDAKNVTVGAFTEDAPGWCIEANQSTSNRFLLAWPPLAAMTLHQIQTVCERIAACARAGAWLYVLALYHIACVGNDTAKDEGWMRYADAFKSFGLQQVVCAKQRYAVKMPVSVRQQTFVEALQVTWGAPLAACLTKELAGCMSSETHFTAHVVCGMARVPMARHQGVYATVPVDRIARR